MLSLPTNYMLIVRWKLWKSDAKRWQDPVCFSWWVFKHFVVNLRISDDRMMRLLLLQTWKNFDVFSMICLSLIQMKSGLCFFLLQTSGFVFLLFLINVLLIVFFICTYFHSEPAGFRGFPLWIEHRTITMKYWGLKRRAAKTSTNRCVIWSWLDPKWKLAKLGKLDTNIENQFMRHQSTSAVVHDHFD